MIDVTVAQSIVEKMKAIIHQEMNFFSTEGIIIASTDQKRIGQAYHEAAQLVLKTKEPIVIEYEGQYEGAKKGINLPVIIDHNIVGVIGITGEKSDVIHYGEIIKEMTQILILNNTARELVFNRRNINQNIINYILQPEDSRNVNLELLYDIDFNLKRFAIVGIPLNPTNFSQDNLYSSIFLEIEMLLGDVRQNFFDIKGDMITIFVHSESGKHAQKLAVAIQSNLKRKFNLNFIFGCGLEAYTIQDLQKSLREAATTLKWNKTLNIAPVLSYQDVGYGIVFNDIKPNNSKNFISKIFGGKNKHEILQLIHLLTTYEKHNGSIQKCADELFIHKNTVQYQLNKIYEDTGYSPRNMSDFFTLKLAAILFLIHHQEID